MAQPGPPEESLPILGMIGARADLLARAEDAVSRWFGPAILRSADMPFDQTDYYEPEMGTGLTRRFCAFGNLLDPAGLAEVKLWNLASGQVAHNLQGHNGNVFGTAFSADGTLLASSGDDGTLKLWDVATGRALHDLRHGGEGLTVAFAPDGSLLAYSGADNRVYLWGIPR